jgi:CRP-like cAMP-binding protein
MEDLKLFEDFLRKFVRLSDDEFMEWVHPIIRIRKFPKKTIVTHAGEVEDYFNFILKGLARKYFIKGKEEINTQISFEDHIILAQESFHSRIPSEYIIETIEPTTFVSIHFNDIEKLFAANSKMEHLARLIVTYTMVIKDRWQMKLVRLTPRERFIEFVRKNPELMQRVPQKHLASFLHIKPETFSRFKHLLKSNNKNSNALSV